MREVSLRLPYLIYLSIGAMLVGVLLAPLFRELPPPQPAVDLNGHEMAHGTLEVPVEDAPTVDLQVTKDAMAGWNLTLWLENFTFTPQDVNTQHVPNAGHAHLYLNGDKIARLYSPYFHLPELPEGMHEIAVTLSSNDHSYYVIDGARIEARTQIVQEAAGDER